MRIFVTGATGFVGAAAARRLVEVGHDVRAMSRSEAGDARLVGLGATPVRCDLDNVRALHLDGVDAVVHAGAYVKAWGPYEAYWRANVEGTRRMLRMAREACVRRFIHIGTEAAVFRGDHLRDVDESRPLELNSPFAYAKTKAWAEKAVREANDPTADGDGTFETIVLRPRFVWGPGDQTLLPAIQAVATQGAFQWIDGGRAQTSTCHIDNLVDAIVLALTQGKPGEAYFITDGETISMRDMLSAMAGAVGLALPQKQISGGAARLAAGVMATAWSVFRLKGAPPVTPFAAAVMSRDCTLKIDKARADLGYAPRVSIDAGLRSLAART